MFCCFPGKARSVMGRLFARIAGPRQRPPHIASVKGRDISAEVIGPGGRQEAFDQPEAIALNQARLDHLESYKFPVDGKRVLDVGCGVGHLAQFFVQKRCQVTCVDGRAENIARLRELYPGLDAHVLDVEREPLSRFGEFHIVFAYGVLYHLENPIAGLRNMASVCREILMIETQICDAKVPLLRMEDECGAHNQALRGIGCRPSPSFVAFALNRIGFPFVYAPVRVPDHPDFHFQWKDNLDWRREGHNMRCIFFASRARLTNPGLIDLIQ